jgi:hypothetical protein
LWAATGGATVERWRKIWHQVCWDGMDRDMFYSFFLEKKLGDWGFDMFDKLKWWAQMIQAPKLDLMEGV